MLFLFFIFTAHAIASICQLLKVFGMTLSLWNFPPTSLLKGHRQSRKCNLSLSYLSYMLLILAVLDSSHMSHLLNFFLVSNNIKIIENREWVSLLNGKKALALKFYYGFF